nr:hypothetical protein StreXyl84_73600 [Streptomyces sp. Xyl84]
MTEDCGLAAYALKVLPAETMSTAAVVLSTDPSAKWRALDMAGFHFWSQLTPVKAVTRVQV